MAQKRTQGPPALYPKNPDYAAYQSQDTANFVKRRAAKVAEAIFPKPYYVTHPNTGERISCDSRAECRKWANKLADDTQKETQVIEAKSGKVIDSYEP
jgi:hypothetical protein